MSTWKCPNCGAKNPAENHFRPDITCAACAESFDAEYNNESEPAGSSKKVTVELTTKFFIQKQVKIFIIILIGAVVLSFIFKPYLIIILDYFTSKSFGY
jgi:uncharacterized membrane protein YvbJ